MKRDALVIGINQYPFLKDTRTKKVKHLTTPANDAEAIAQLLEKYGEFRDVRRLPAVNKDDELQVDSQEMVKLEQVKRAITDLFCPQRDQVPETAILFFAGHGLRRDLGNKTEGYLATSDASPRKELWGISLHWLRKILQDSPIRQQIIWLDCCHSGELLNFIEKDLPKSKEGRDRCFIAASRDFQVAYEQREGEHGILTNALLQGLNPELQPDKWVTNISLVNFVKETLKKAPQHPVYSNPDGQIILTSTQSSIFDVCPYKGLAFFDFNDQDPQYFYGRETLINQLIDKVCENNFLAVLGASGSGKSSAVRAGLLHRLRLGEILPGSDRWKIYEPFTPGEHPLKSLEQVVGVKPEQLQALVKATPTDKVLLVVDQFEEVFTLCRDKTEREQFFKYLLDALKQLGNKLCLVLAMRADFQGKCSEQEYAGLAAKIDQNLVRVMPMSKDELKQAIIEPGKKVGLEIDRELVNQMIEDVSGSPGDLPLMQYTLTELWKQQTLGRLTINEYTRLGGVKEALRKRANQIYASLSSEEQLIAKQIFLELTHLGEGTEDTRRQVRQEDLVTQRRSRELVEEVLQRLAEEKLVVTGEQEFEGKSVAVVNIAHEALIRNWDLLGKWLKENREALLVKQDIEEAARDWREKNNPKEIAYLLQGTRLAVAEDYIRNYSDKVPLSSTAEEFVRVSQFEQKRRQQRTIFQISGTVIGALVLSVFGWWQWQLSIINESRNLAARSSRLLASNQNFEALTTSLQAEKKLRQVFLDKSDVRRQLSDQLQLLAYKTRGQVQAPIKLFEPKNKDSSLGHTLIDPDNKQLIVAGKNSTVQLKDWSGKKLVEFPTNQLWINGFYFTPGKQHLVTVGSDATLRLWKLSGKQVTEFQQNIAPFNSIDFTSNQKSMATVSKDGTVSIFNNLDQKLLSFYVDSAEKVAFSPDGKYLAVGNKNYTELRDLLGKKLSTVLGSLSGFSPDSKYLATLINGSVKNEHGMRLWNISGEEVAWFNTDGTSLEAVFSPDSRKVITFGASRFARLWDISGTQLASLRSNAKFFKEFTFGSDSQHLLSLDFDNSSQLWNLSGNKIAEVGEGSTVLNPNKTNFVASYRDKHSTIIWNFLGEQSAELIPGKGNASFTKDGEQLAIVGDDGALRIWDVSKYQKPIFKSNIQALSGIKLSHDRKYLADSTKDGQVRIQNLLSTQTKQFKAHDSNICKLVFNPNNSQIATGSDDGTVRLWNYSGEKLAGFNVGAGFFQCHAYDPADKYADLIFSPNGKHLASIGNANDVILWDESGKQILKHFLDIHPILGHRREFRWGISFSLDGKFLIAHGAGDKTKIWDTSSGFEVAELRVNTPDNILSSAVFSPDNKYLVTQESGSIRVWDSSFKEIKKFTTNPNYISRFFITPDSQQLVITENKTVSILNLSTLELNSFSHDNQISVTLLRPNSNHFLTVDNQKIARLSDFYGKQITQFQLPKLPSKFSPDGKLLAVYGENMLHIWDMASSKQIAELPIVDSGIVFTPDSKQIIATKNDGTTRFWLIKSYDELVSDICDRISYYLKNSKEIAPDKRKVCDM